MTYMRYLQRGAFGLLLLTYSAQAQSVSQSNCPPQITQRIVDKKVTNGNEIKDQAVFKIAGCKITNWNIGVNSEYGNSSYTTNFNEPDTITVKYELKSSFGFLTVNTAALQLDLNASLVPITSAVPSAKKETASGESPPLPVQAGSVLLGLAAMIIILALVAIRTPGRNSVIITGIVGIALSIMYGFNYMNKASIKIGNMSIDAGNVGLLVAFLTTVTFMYIYARTPVSPARSRAGAIK